MAGLRDPGGGDGASRQRRGGVGMVPGARPGGRADREPGAGAGGAARGRSPGERVRPVSRSDGVRGAGGRRGVGRGVPAVRGGGRVSGERGGGDGARARLAGGRSSGAGGALVRGLAWALSLSVGACPGGMFLAWWASPL